MPSSAHKRMSRGEARAEALELLRAVQIRDPEKRLSAYPHELSGGMCQRVMIAMAISCNPALLIADEPTTGLDVTTQKVVMDLLARIAAERGMATILITHDLGLAARYCRRVVVMEQGRLVEEAEPEDPVPRSTASLHQASCCGFADRDFPDRGPGDGRGAGRVTLPMRLAPQAASLRRARRRCSR